jgi:hypothetical protein
VKSSIILFKKGNAIALVEEERELQNQETNSKIAYTALLEVLQFRLID